MTHLTTVNITIDIDDLDHEVIHTWAALHAAHMLDELWRSGVTATLVGIEVNSVHHDQCSPSHAEP